VDKEKLLLFGKDAGNKNKGIEMAERGNSRHLEAGEFLP
jgi:hypothetical protein